MDVQLNRCQSTVDRLREDRKLPGCSAPPALPDFEREVATGIAFVTFSFGIDGVSIEIAKDGHHSEDVEQLYFDEWRAIGVENPEAEKILFLIKLVRLCCSR